MSLEFNGERFLTECKGEIVYEHWHRYLLARDIVAGKRVLDVASGEGYGSHLLASAAQSVIGVDISPDAVRHASEKYVKNNLQYIAASCTQIPLPDASVDIIVSYETIEHIDEASQQAFLSEINRLLTPDGILLISSPNRPEYSDKRGYANEFHVKEFDEAELKVAISQYWPEQIWLGQRLSFHSIIWPINVLPEGNWASTHEGERSYPEAMYFLVLCAKSAAALAPIKVPLSFVTDKEDSVYRAWMQTYRDNVAIHGENERLRSLQSAPPNTATAPSAVPTPLPAAEHWLVRWARKITA